MPEPETLAAVRSKGEQSRSVIIEAAKHLIAQRGFVGVTVNDILEAAEITKGKFFHHFSSKEDLFSELLRTALSERAVHRFEEILERCDSKDSFEKLLFLLDWLIDWHGKGLPEGMRLCLFATFFFAPDSEEMREIHRVLSSNSKEVERLIRACQREGYLPEYLDPEVISLLIPSASVGGNIIGFLSRRKRLTPDNIIELRKMLVSIKECFAKGKALHQ